MQIKHTLEFILTENHWTCSCGEWTYCARREDFTPEQLKLAHKRHKQRFDLRKDWRVPGVGSLFKCPQCGKQVIKNRREHKFCSRKCAARHRYGWSISK
jgi:hypothetical protein